MLIVNHVLCPSHINTSTTFTAGYTLLKGCIQRIMGQKAQQESFLRYSLNEGATQGSSPGNCLQLVAKRQGVQGEVEVVLLTYIKFQMVTVCLSALLEQSTPLNYCGSLVAAFAPTLHGAYLPGTVVGKTGKKMFGIDKKLTQEQIGMNRPEQNIG